MMKIAIVRGFMGLDALGILFLLTALVGGALFFLPGLETLFTAWQLAEYSHGPLIPLLSGFLLLRQLKTMPERPGFMPFSQRVPGLTLLGVGLLLGLLGLFAHIGDVVAYALIVWIGGLLLLSFGWDRGKALWPPVLHLAFMLPLPGLLYYKVSTALQFISSEVGVWALMQLGTPVFLEGNIIDLGVYKLHVAEACSGLRYLFPIMSFSYIFAVLYRGPSWHKAVLLLSAVPLAVLMNSFRIALVGVMVNAYGIEQAEGLSHLMEGWVVFLSCILVLFGLAALMLRLQPAPRMNLSEALDLDLEKMVPELARIRHVRPSAALIAAAALTLGLASAWALAPDRIPPQMERAALDLFPRSVGEWQAAGPARELSPDVERTLGADDYISLSYARAGALAPVEFFSAWYLDQTKGGIHSPEICLPGGGWEMTSIEAVDVGLAVEQGTGFWITRAVITKDGARLLVYYWFDQSGRKIASDYMAKAMLLWSGLTKGRTDGALVRLTTPVLPGETAEQAEVRLTSFLSEAADILPGYVDGVRR
jgi:exosortase D (VPLPA-CTERM-specific)